MRRQPKYNFFKNTVFAFQGLKDIIKNEKSFKIELFLFFLLFPFIFIIETSFESKLLLFISLILVLIAEAINSAIERVVDLITTDFNKLAGQAKDIGSLVVLLTIILAFCVWISVILKSFFS